MTDLKQLQLLLDDMKHANCQEASLIRSPLITDPDGTTHGEYEKCSYAFFPGCQLGAEEPELVAKVYDALLFQNSDTAIFMQCCGKSLYGKDSFYDSNAASLKAHWENLGRPTIICACPACMTVFKREIPEAEVISLYEMFLQLQIGGGCNSVDYGIYHPPVAEDETREAVEALAEDMGVKLHKYSDQDEFDLPLITYSIKLRNNLKKEGHDAAHILELMFGMGQSNTHLIHEHDHHHDDQDSCDDVDNHDEEMERPAPSPLPTEDERRANREELKSVLLSLYWNE